MGYMENSSKQQELIQLQGILKDKGSLADNTRRIQIDCQEATPEQLLSILQHNGTIGWFMFSPNPIQEEHIPDIPLDPEIKEKSPSQQQRAIFYRMWENTDRSKDFPDYYKSQMFKFNEHLKEKYLQ